VLNDVSMMVVSSCASFVLLVFSLIFVSLFDVESLVLKSCNSLQCYNGEEKMDGDLRKCECHPGWIGNSCERCGGKIRCNISKVLCLMRL